jgi:hypothetical protein
MKIRSEAFKVFKFAEDENEVLRAISSFEDNIKEFDHNHCQVCHDKAFMT